MYLISAKGQHLSIWKKIPVNIPCLIDSEFSSISIFKVMAETSHHPAALHFTHNIFWCILLRCVNLRQNRHILWEYAEKREHSCQWCRLNYLLRDFQPCFSHPLGRNKDPSQKALCKLNEIIHITLFTCDIDSQHVVTHAQNLFESY